LVYGEWLFIQSLVDAHSDKAVYKLWSNIAQYDGFEALSQTLAFYDDNIPNMFARYHIQNLTRDYKFAPQFNDATVWLGGNITASGRISGYGVQELGANYVAFHPTPGTYNVSVVGDDSLELWAVGIAGDQADAILLGQGGTISNANYDYMYLIAFNPAYDDDVDDCVTVDYSIETTVSNRSLSPVTATWDATHFLPLHDE
jgi:hypothetical protein